MGRDVRHGHRFARHDLCMSNGLEPGEKAGAMSSMIMGAIDPNGKFLRSWGGTHSVYVGARTCVFSATVLIWITGTKQGIRYSSPGP